MKIETLAFTDKTGWSVTDFPVLDSDRTLVTIFGASGFIDHPRPILDLLAAYPRAHVIGCSTAGEIFGRPTKGWDERLTERRDRWSRTQNLRQPTRATTVCASFAELKRQAGPVDHGGRCRPVFSWSTTSPT